MDNQSELDASNAAWFLSAEINDLIKEPDYDTIQRIRSYWDNESWEDIVYKFQTPGTVWHVWWMDGVAKFMLEGENV